MQSDINWILEEIRNLKDPHLIEALKELLQSKSRQEKSTSKEQYTIEVNEAEERIASGQFITHEEMLKALDKW